MIAKLLLFSFAIGLISAKENKVLMSLYQRPLLPIDPNNNTFTLYMGLTKNHYITAQKLPFIVDFNYNHILLAKSLSCSDLGFCFGDSSGTESDSYNGKSYDYKTVQALAAPQVVSPAEIDENIAKAVSRSKMRIAQNNPEGLPNVLGLSPNADAWNDWNDEYYFRYQTLNITYHRYPGNDYINFYSKIHKEDVMVIVEKNDKYIFDAKFVDGNYNQNVKVCVKTTTDIYFELNDSLYQHMKDIICKSGSSCTTKNDLKSRLDGVVSVDLSDPVTGRTVSGEIYVDDLVSIKEDGKTLVYNFAKNGDANFKKCDMILQNKFFEHYYLLISNRMDSKPYIMLGFRAIRSSDFFMKNLWKYLLIATVIFLATLIVFYTIKRCRKPSDNETDYTTLPFTQSQKEKNE